ncbi:MAG: gamma-glutamyl-gamma-aminobutyrate hydrolase family protein [Thermotogae bacterium]|nr:gamma-glutamyl-gamma-aminobutyrate hydrolase family protein [Thermotogota bacterium]
MRVLITASRPGKAKNYVRYLEGLGEVEVITPSDAKLPPFDLLVLSGGEDVHPKFYGEDIRYPDLLDIYEARDRMELTLIGRALRDGKPIFGICRGLQILAVALGGTLYQDIGMEGFRAEIHRAEEGDVLHGVRFLGDFADVFGEGGTVNSKHHQAVKTLPDGAKILAVAEDGLVEAFHLKSAKALAVQWHPERHGSPLSEALLDYLRGFIGWHPASS